MDPIHILLVEHRDDVFRSVFGAVPSKDDLVLTRASEGINACSLLRRLRPYLKLIIVNPQTPWVNDPMDTSGCSFLRHISRPCSRPSDGCTVVVISDDESAFNGFQKVKEENLPDFFRNHMEKITKKSQ